MSKMVYIILAIVCVLVVLVSCLKYPKIGKWLILGVVGVAFLVLTIFSCVSLFEYDTAKSTTHGNYADLKMVVDNTTLNNNDFVVEVDV